MEDLKEYYNKFNSEELHLLEQQNKEFNALLGMMESLRVVENSLGTVHKTTIELRKMVNGQIDKLSTIIFPQTLIDKLFKE